MNSSPSGFDSKALVLLNIQQSQTTNVLTELHEINKSFSSSVICASVGTYLSYKVMCCSPAIQAKLGVLHFADSPPQDTACPGCAVVTAPPDLSIFKEPKLILVQMMPTREGPGALIKPPTPENQPPPWVLLVLCPSKVLSGRLCWRSMAPALKGNVVPLRIR